MKLDTLLANQEQIKIDCENAIVGGFVFMLQKYFRDLEKEFLDYFKLKYINVINHKQSVKEFMDGFDFNLNVLDLIDIIKRKREMCFEYGIENAKVGILQVIKFQEDREKQTKDINADVITGYVNGPDYARDAMIFINQQNSIFDGNMLNKLGKNIDRATATQVYDQLQLGFANMEGMNQLGDRVQGVFDGCSQTRALMIARTETMRAFNSSTIDSYSVSGIDLVQWLISNDERTCEICLARDGGIYKIENPPLSNPLLDSQFAPLGNPSANLNYNYFFNNASQSSRMTQMLGDTGFANSNVEILNSFEMKYKYGNQLAFFDNKVNKLFLNGKYYGGDFGALEKYIAQSVENGVYKQGINGEWFLQKELARKKFIDAQGWLLEQVKSPMHDYYLTLKTNEAIIGQFGDNVIVDGYISRSEMLMNIYANNAININMTRDMAVMLKEIGITPTGSYNIDISSMINNIFKRGHIEDVNLTLERGTDLLIKDANKIGIKLSESEARDMVHAAMSFSDSSSEVRAASQGLDFFESFGYNAVDFNKYAKYAEDLEKLVRFAPQYDANIIYRGLGDAIDKFQYLPIGAEIELGGPASFSSELKWGSRFMQHGMNADDSVMLILKGESKFSTSIRHISAFDNEQELIVSGIPKYRILEITTKTNKFFYKGTKEYLEVIIELIE